MTGSPLLRLAFVLIALIALAIPLARMTARPEASSASVDSSTPARPTTRSVTIAVTTTSTPASLTLTAPGRTVATDPEAPFTTDLPTNPTDIIIRASWPEAVPHAVRVVASIDDIPLVDHTFWATDTLADVLTLPGTSEP